MSNVDTPESSSNSSKSLSSATTTTAAATTATAATSAFICRCPALTDGARGGGSVDSEFTESMANGGALVVPQCVCLVRLALPRSTATTILSAGDCDGAGVASAENWRRHLSPLLAEQLAAHGAHLGLRVAAASDTAAATPMTGNGGDIDALGDQPESRLLHVVTGTNLLCVTVQIDRCAIGSGSGSSGISADCATAGSDSSSGGECTRSLLIYAANSVAGDLSRTTDVTAKLSENTAKLSGAGVSVNRRDIGDPASGTVECGLNSVTKQLTIIQDVCRCRLVTDAPSLCPDSSVLGADKTAITGNKSTSDQNESSQYVCPLHQQLLHLVAGDVCSQQMRVTWWRCGQQLENGWLLMRLLTVCSQRSCKTHLQLVVENGRELRALLATGSCQRQTAVSTPSALSSSPSTSTYYPSLASDVPGLDHIDRLQLLSSTRCVDVMSVAQLFPHLLALDVRPYCHNFSRACAGLLNAIDSGCLSTTDDERCVCRYRAGTSVGSALNLGRLVVARLESVCSTALAALRNRAKCLNTLHLIECRLKEPRSVFISGASGRDRVVVSVGSGREGGRTSFSGRGRSFRDIIQAVLRRKVVTMPNIQIRSFLFEGRCCPSAALINSNFPCLKRLSVTLGGDSGGWSHPVNNDPALIDPTQPTAQLWFPSLEWLRICYSGVGCDGGGGGGDCEPRSMFRHPLRRLTHYTQHFGSLSWRRLIHNCPALQCVCLDPVMVRPLPAPSSSLSRSSSDSASSSSTRSDQQLERLTVSWCDVNVLETLVQQIPGLRQLNILDPPVSDKRVWSPLVQRLQQRDVHVQLLW